MASNAAPAFDKVHLLSPGIEPAGPLLVHPDGNLYGVATGSGYPGGGILYRVTPGGRFKVVRIFAQADHPSAATFGTDPQDKLATGEDGTIYGVTNAGGANGHGVIYALEPDGEFQVVHHFTDELNPGGLVHAGEGGLHGLARAGGAKGGGRVFRVTGDGTFETILDLPYAGTDSPPWLSKIYPDLVKGPGGNLYGTIGGETNLLSLSPTKWAGVLFRIDAGGSITLLRAMPGFDGPSYFLAGSDQAALALVKEKWHQVMAGSGTLSPALSLPDFARRPSSLSFLPDGTGVGLTQSGGQFGTGFLFQIAPSTQITKLMDRAPNDRLQLVFATDADDHLYALSQPQAPGDRSQVLRVRLNSIRTNRAPHARKDAISTEGLGARRQGGSNVFHSQLDLLKNDTDPDGDTLRIVSIEQPKHGKVRLLPGSRLVAYKVEGRAPYNDAFTYRISDLRGGYSKGRVQIRLPVMGEYPVALRNKAGKRTGTVTVVCTSETRFVATLDVRAKSYRFTGTFGSNDKATASTVQDGERVVLSLHRRPLPRRWQMDVNATATSNGDGGWNYTGSYGSVIISVIGGGGVGPYVPFSPAISLDTLLNEWLHGIIPPPFNFLEL